MVLHFFLYKSDFEINLQLQQFSYIEEEFMTFLIKTPSPKQIIHYFTDPTAISASHLSTARKIRQRTKLMRDGTESSSLLHHYLYDFITVDQLRYFHNVL
jgi:hypothetical protein